MSKKKIKKKSKSKEKKDKLVGIIGLGIIGSRVAKRFKGSNYKAIVWNRTPPKKPLKNYTNNLSELIKNVKVIQIFVSNDQALKSIIKKILPHVTKKHVIFNHSTVDIKTTLIVDEILSTKKATFFDAPFTGSKLAAENSQLVYYISGQEKLKNKYKKILKISSRKIITFKKIGDSTIIKIATNLIAADTIQILSESLRILRAYGMNEKDLMKAMTYNVINSKIHEMKLSKVIDNDYEPHFTVKNMHKDIGIAIKMAESKKCNIPATKETFASLKKLNNKKNGHLDFAILAKE